MRRRRHKLEVSTFPFLAVLLCAMGSLILMLLVLDRRAKAAARERAQRAAEQITADAVRLADQHRREWERRRQALHDALAGQERELRGKLATVESEIAATESKLQAEHERRDAQQGRLRRERGDLARLEQDVAAQRDEIARAADKVQDSEQELRRLTGDLKMLEHTLAELKAIRQRQQSTYSVVPYRGRRGAEQAPLYLECAASGLIFHPDGKTISTLRAGGEEVRTEIDHRIGQQRMTPTAESGRARATPYVLLLVRPDGISTYYQALKCLQGLDLDYGYELIDADWVLEFPKEGEEIKPQPWMAAEKSTAVDGSPQAKPGRTPATVGRISNPAGPGRIGNAAHGLTAEEFPTPGPVDAKVSDRGSTAFGAQRVNGQQASGPLTGGAAFGPPSGSSCGMPSAQSAWRPGTPGTGNTASGAGPWHSAGSGSMPGSSPGAGGGDSPKSASVPSPTTTTTLGAATPGGRPQGVNFGAQVGGSHPIGPPLPTAGGPGLGGPSGGPMPLSSAQSISGATASLASPGQHPEGNGPSIHAPGSGPATGLDSAPASSKSSAGAEVSGSPNSQPAGASEDPSPGHTATQTGASTKLNAQPGESSVPSPGSGGPSTGESAGAAPHSPTPLPPSASRSSRPVPASNTDQSGTAAGSGSPVTAGKRSEPSGDATPAGERRPGLRRLDDPLPGNKRKGPPPSLRPALIGGDRDYIIPIECRADKVIVHPYGNSFSSDSLAPGNGGAALLQETINRMIARRQMAVRPGELPYRPQVRFMVRPDGLRALHRAYPVLDELHIPLTRQNLEADEEISISE
jgi:hypothetical protein